MKNLGAKPTRYQSQVSFQCRRESISSNRMDPRIRKANSQIQDRLSLILNLGMLPPRMTQRGKPRGIYPKRDNKKPHSNCRFHIWKQGRFLY